MWMSDGRDCAGDLRQSLRGGAEDERDAIIFADELDGNEKQIEYIEGIVFSILL